MQAPEFANSPNMTELSDWRKLRVLPEKSSDSVIVGRLTTAYSIREAYDRAKKEGDTFLSPHGMFRGLAPGNRKQAIEFLETFGPLFDKRTEQGIVGVDIATFWAEQNVFRLVAGLHELYELRSAAEPLWEALEKFDNQILRRIGDAEIRELAEAFAHGKAKINAESARFPGASTLSEFIEAQELEGALNPQRRFSPRNNQVEKGPRDWYSLNLRGPIERRDENPRMIALHIVEHAIRYYTCGIRFDWVLGRRGQDAGKFQRHLCYDSLLEAIWDLFAADTAGVPWRICPNDGNIFYPPRADRFYCTSAEQVAASKANYERRRNRKRTRKSRRRR